jgi:3-oxoacyl-[acyl-carrier-protein] synthase-3
MGARIESVDFVRSGSGLLRKGSIKLAVQAALGCLKKADMPPNEVDLLINTGIYRDENIGEPAIASLIQQGIKANPGVKEDGQGTFSFDLANGGCGLVTAMNIVHNLMESEDIDVGLVVTSDADPVPGTSEGYEFVPAGAAVLLEPSDTEEGFVGFKSETYPKYEDMFESRVVFIGDKERPKGRNILRISERKAYMARCVDCAQKSVEAFIEKAGLDLKALDLIITSQTPVGFPRKFRVRMGLRKSRVVDISEEYGPLHTAGPAAALDAAIEDGRFARAERVLFVTVGAGITVSLALYHKEREEEVDQEGLAVEEGEEDELVGMLEEDEEDEDGSEG